MPRNIALLSFLALLIAPVAGAQDSAVSGQLVNAAGEGLDGVTVELLAAEGGQPVGAALQTGTTGARGFWAFSGVPVGEYVVQAVIEGAVAGIPVSVGAAAVTGVVLTAPTAAAIAAAAGAAAGTAAGAAAGGAAAAGGLSAAAIAGIAGAAGVAAVAVVRDDES